MSAGRVGLTNKVLGGVPFPLSPQSPLLTGLELYLDSRLGLGSFADGASVNSWPDQSGHSPSRDAVTQAGWNNPTMGRIGSVLTPKGQPTVVWATPDNPTPQGLGSAGSFVWPSIASGYTIYWYGRPHQKTTPAWNFVNQHWFGSDGAALTNVFSILDTGGAPQSYGIQDNSGGGNPHRFGTTASIVDGWHLLTMMLPPPDNGTVPCRFFVDGVEVPQFSGPANYQSNIGTGQYFLGNSVAGNISMRAEMGWKAWYSNIHSDRTVQRIALDTSIVWGF